jgi:signal transduction histidine kinase/PAS domain-containing protein
MVYFKWWLLALDAIFSLFLFKWLKVSLQSYSFRQSGSRKCKDYSNWQQYPQAAFLDKKTQQRILNLSVKQFAIAACADFCFILQLIIDKKLQDCRLSAGIVFGNLIPPQYLDCKNNDLGWLVPLYKQKQVLIKQDFQEVVFQKIINDFSPINAAQKLQLLAIPLSSLSVRYQVIILGRCSQKPFSLKILKNLSDCLQSLSLFVEHYQKIEILEQVARDHAKGEKRFLDIFEANPLPLLVFDKKGLLIKANQAFFNRFEKFLPVSNISDFYNIFSCNQKLIHDFQKALKNSIVDGECECLLDATTVMNTLPTFWSYRFLQIGQGDNILLELQDISSQWQALYYQGLFEKFFHSAKNGFCVIDAQENIVFINNFLRGGLLHLQEDVQGQSFRKVFDIKNWQLALQKPLELTLKRPSMPESKTVLLSAIAFNDLHPLTLLSFVDVSEQKSREMQLLQLAKMESIGVFACGLSHDFNNVITIIKGNVDFLLNELNDNGEITALLTDTLSAVEEGRQLIQRLLKFARGYHEEVAPYRLKDMLKTLQILLNRTLSKEIQLSWQEVQIDPQWELVVNLSCFDNALLNLFINARQSLQEKFSSKHLSEAKIAFTAEKVILEESLAVKSGTLQPGAYAVLSVWDNGLGMDEAIKNNILTPFYTTKQGGTGLGLSMVLYCVEQAKGGIDFDSEAGEWAVFRLYFPLVAWQ